MMNIKNDDTFGSTIDYFSEETANARRIIQNACKEQNLGLPPNLYAPFVDLSGITPEEHAALQEFFANMREKVKADANRTPSKEVLSYSPYLSPMPPQSPYMVAPVIRDLSHLMKRTKQSEDSPYSFMASVLSRYRLFYYSGTFYCQENCIFRPISEQELRSAIFPIVEPELAAGKNAKLIGNIIELLRDCPYTKVNCTTETPDRVFFTNGVYDLTRHELLPPLPMDFVTAYLPFQYNPSDKDCPVFDRFLLEISGGNTAVISLIWEIIGYLLSSDMSAKAFFLLQGVGDSGKSVLGNLISSMFNPEALAHLDIYRFKDKFATSALLGKRLNICMDLPRARISREAIGVIKSLTGDDTITVERKFRPSESYKSTCKLLFGSNFPLMPADSDSAFCARLVTVPFLYPIPKERQDKHLLEKLLMERSAIAVKALDAYLLLRARNYQFLQVQGEMCPVTGYISDAELMDAFLAGCCMFSDEAYTFTADLLAAYNQFRASRGAPPLTDPAIFSRQLNQFCPRPIHGKRRRINGANLNGYQGIGLRIPGSEISEEV